MHFTQKEESIKTCFFPAELQIFVSQKL